jgi:very-short-patch-repair endonuclease
MPEGEHPGQMGSTVTELIELVDDLGGVVRSARIAERGFSRRTVDAAITRGALIRPRRGWLAAPATPRTLLDAARVGVVITCRTAAQHYRLWLHDTTGPAHVAVPVTRTGKVGVRARVHWGSPLIPRDPDALIDPIENVLGFVADCEPFEQALATWDSAFNQGLVDMRAMSRLPLRPAARRVLAHASPFADAGLETYLRPRLRWLRVPLRIQIWIHGHRVDTLIGDRLVLQIDGKHHVGPQRSEDIRHDAELMLLGYHVIRVSYPQVMFDWPSVQDLIMRAVAQGLHLAA